MTRVRACFVVLLVACGHGPQVTPDGPATTCTRVRAETLAGGVVRLVYGDAPASWVVDAAPGTSDARVTIDDACRVRVVLADGTVAVDDAEPLADGVLVRHALADRVYDSGDSASVLLPTVGKGWAGDSRWPDVSSAAGRAWWGAQVARVLDLGVSGVWLDVNEPTTFPEGGGGTTLPDDVPVDGDGRATTMGELHDAYANFQARATYERSRAAVVTGRSC